MSSEDIGYIVHNVLYVLTMLNMIASLIGFIYVNIIWNHSSHCKARSRLLYAIHFFAINRTATLCLTNFLDIPESHCLIITIFYKIIIPRVPETLAFRAVRSYLLYKLTQQNLREQFKYVIVLENNNTDTNKNSNNNNETTIKIINKEEENGIRYTEDTLRRAYKKRILSTQNMKSKISSFINDLIFPNPKKQSSDKNLMIYYIIIYLISGSIPLVTIIYMSISDSNIIDICLAPAIDTWSKLTGAFAVISCIVIFILLKEVHDGYFLKNEIIIHAILGIAGLIVYPFLFTMDNIEWLELSSIMIITILMSITSYIYLPFLIYQEIHSKIQLPNSNLSLNNNTIDNHDHNSSNITDNNNISKKKPFDTYSDFLEIMNSSYANDYIVEFVKHYGNQYSYIVAIKEFIDFENTTNENSNIGHAYLLYNKYIADNAKYSLGFPREIKDIYGCELQSETFLINHHGVKKEYFHPALKCIENNIDERVIKIFVNCDIHKTFYEKENVKNHGFIMV
jgi:hypothetical protein